LHEIFYRPKYFQIKPKRLFISNLRTEVNFILFIYEAQKAELPELDYKRARHAITEIKRTELAARLLTENKIKEFGDLMNQSHDSLR
jgi:galactokinase